MTRDRIIWRQAILIYLGIVCFFLLMKVFNLDQIVELRLLNFAIVFWGLNTAIKLSIKNDTPSDYLSNFSLAIMTASTALIMVCVSLVVYLEFIDPSFMQVMEQTGIWGKNLSVLMVVFGIAVEGFASSVISSFILMQFWKQKSTRLVN
ncbi:MAG: hypothetical protein ACPGR7_01240 [Flavobacteriaceae bacterium]